MNRRILPPSFTDRPIVHRNTNPHPETRRPRRTGLIPPAQREQTGLTRNRYSVSALPNARGLKFYYDSANRAWLTKEQIKRRYNLSEGQLNYRVRIGDIIPFHPQNRRATEIVVRPRPERARPFPRTHYGPGQITTGQFYNRFLDLGRLYEINNIENEHYNNTSRYRVFRMPQNEYLRGFRCITDDPPPTLQSFLSRMITTLQGLRNRNLLQGFPLSANSSITITFGYIYEGETRYKEMDFGGDMLWGDFIQKLRKLMNTIEHGNIETAVAMGSDPLLLGSIIDTSLFGVTMINDEAGGAPFKRVDASMEDQFPWCSAVNILPYNFSILDNNCFFRCLKAAIGNHDRNFTVVQMRRSFGIEHDDEISIEMAASIAEQAHIRLIIYDAIGEVLLKDDNNDNERKKVQLILDRNHYYWIKGFNDKDIDKNIVKNYIKKKPHVLLNSTFSKKELPFVRRCYDFETVSDPRESFFCKGYCITWIDSIKDCYQIGEDEWEYGPWHHDTEVKHFFNFNVFDSARKFAELCLNDAKSCYIQLTDYNGAKFDKFILLAEFSKLCTKISNMVYTNNNIYSYEAAEGRIFDLDICKIIPGCSLEQACIDFDVSKRKLTLDHFTHADINFQYKIDNIENWLQIEKDGKTFKEYIIEYAERDSVCLQELCTIVEDSLIDIMGPKGELGYGLHTLGRKAKTYWLENLDEEIKQKIPVETFIEPDNPIQHLKEDMYKFMRKAMVAGRTQCFRKKGDYYHGEMEMLDVKSEYPYVMENNPFPVGKPEWKSYEYVMSQFNSFGWYKICEKPGFYKVRVCNQHELVRNKKLKVNVIANSIIDGKGFKKLDWCADYSFNKILNTADILACLKWGIEVLPTEKLDNEEENDPNKNAIVFPEWAYIFKDFIPVLRKLKTEQDKFKEDKDPRYKPGKRQMFKNFQNSMSGKAAQKAYEDNSQLIYSLEGKRKFLKDHNLKDLKIINNNLALITGTKKPIIDESTGENLLAYRSMPQIATYIYSYGHDLMLPIYMNYDCIYGDTDSALVGGEDFKKILEFDSSLETFTDIPLRNILAATGAIPRNKKIMGSEFGDFELEKFECDLSEGYEYIFEHESPNEGYWEYKKYKDEKEIVECEINFGYFISPKSYLLGNECLVDEKIVRRTCKSKFKGVKSKDKYISGFVPSLSASLDKEVSEYIIEDFKNLTEKEILDKINDYVEGDVDSPLFYERLLHNLPTTIITNQFVRHLKPDPLNENGYSEFGIRLMTILKRVTMY